MAIDIDSILAAIDSATTEDAAFALQDILTELGRVASLKACLLRGPAAERTARYAAAVKAARAAR